MTTTLADLKPGDEGPKITTHIARRTRNGEWFTAAVDGTPLVGDKGGESLFQSRREAREEAKRRIAAIIGEQP